MKYTLGAFRRDVIRKIRQEGVIKSVLHSWPGFKRRLFHRNGHMDPFDALHKTDTAKEVGVGSMDLPADQAVSANRYQSTRDIVGFYELIDSLGIDLKPFTFIDMGSGKGRCLLLASAYPFKQIIGVEIAPVLHNIALRNIGLYHARHMQCRNITSVCADALNFDLPLEPTILYMFNPFTMAVMEPFAQKVANSLWANPRPFYVIYRQPSCAEAWSKIPAFKRLASPPDCAIWTNVK